eukprot:gene43668-54249_t
MPIRLNLDQVMADRGISLTELAERSGDFIRPHSANPALAVEPKADASPVTIADRGAEELMRGLIAKKFPAHGIIGEEFGSERPDAEFVWVLDPIDGTKSFISGVPLFGTLIALLQDGWPILGIIDQPISGERWVGALGQPTLFGGQPARTRTCRALADATLATTGPQYFADHDAEHFMALAAQTAHKRMVFGGDCYNYGLLSSGHIDLVVEAGLKLHDFAALVPVVEGAGGTMCDWNGDPLHSESEGRVIALGDPARLEDVVEGLACHH